MKSRRLLIFAVLAFVCVACSKDVPEGSQQQQEQKKEEEATEMTICDLLDKRMNVVLDYKLIGSVPAQGDCYVAQGAASDGTNVYFVLRNSSDSEAIILKYKLDPFTFLAKGKTFNGGHCNDLTYDDATGRIVLAHGQSEGKILTMIDSYSLDAVENVNIPVGSGAITYNKSRDLFAISQGGSSLHIADQNFKVKASYTRSDKTGYTAQGMGSDDKYIYFPMSGSSDNVLVTYDWNGKWVANLKLKIPAESESMFCVNGKYYVCFYAGGSVKGAVLYQIFPKK